MNRTESNCIYVDFNGIQRNQGRFQIPNSKIPSEQLLWLLQIPDSQDSAIEANPDFLIKFQIPNSKVRSSHFPVKENQIPYSEIRKSEP